MFEAERAHLNRWLDEKRTNYFDSNPLLASLLARHGFGNADEYRSFAKVVQEVVDPAAMEDDRWWNHPRVERFDGVGNRREDVVFSPHNHRAGKPAYDAGIVACLEKPGSIRHQSVLFYLLGHCGEMGHLCPVTCTSGLVRALQAKGSKELKTRWLPGLLTPRFGEALIGSQFLTEVQGGSDVGANAVEAVPDPAIPGAYRLRGEKWFCSVAHADLFLLTARPAGAAPGTKGLGCFLVPRKLDDGSANGFVVRRLKEKIGTRTLATAEIDFDGALGWPIGRIDEGFKIAVGIVLNTSRFMNALGAASAMRRAYLECVAFAKHREAFGHPIGRYPLVRETLAIMKAEEAAALTSTFELAGLIDRIDTGAAGTEEQALYRLLVNANKYWTSVMCSDVVHRGIEIFGGNGTIETFSILPRLYRDAIVLESWEGSHNVLCLQVLKDSQKLGLVDAVDRRVRACVEDCSGETASELPSRWADILNALHLCLSDETYAALHIKRHLESLMQATQVALLLEQASWEAARGESTATGAIADFLFNRHLRTDYRPEDDSSYLDRINAVLGADLG